MGKILYHSLPGFEGIYLEDSYVLDIQTEPDSVDIFLEAVLTEKHPRYMSPKPSAFLIIPFIPLVIFILFGIGLVFAPMGRDMVQEPLSGKRKIVLGIIAFVLVPLLIPLLAVMYCFLSGADKS